MRKPKKGQSLAEKYPELAAQWHPTKNGELTPFDFTPMNGNKAWWICSKEDDHVWEAKISDRHKGGCPCCVGRRIVTSNSLFSQQPEIMKEWDYSKNINVNPKKIGSGSSLRVWWICSKNKMHKWDAPVIRRTREKKVGCPFCAGKKVSLGDSLAITHPDLANQWHPTLNKSLNPEMVSKGSTKNIWWSCDEGEDHVWKTTINSRTNSSNSSPRGCPICSGHRVVKSNSLEFVRPDLAKEFHIKKNGPTRTESIHFKSRKKYWWKCDKGEDHEWEATVSDRHKAGCPICSNKKAVQSNCMTTTNPTLAKEWDLKRNWPLTPLDVVEGSGKNVSWICSNDQNHKWKAVCADRSNGSNCPFCSLTPQSKQELTITFELTTLFPGINPRGFKTRLEGKLWSIDIYIPLLHLGIEFDGSYWHKDKRDLDKLKTKKLEREGVNILRVREEPLKKISDSDIMSKQPFNAKEVTNNILTHIMNSFDLEDLLVKKIKAYISKKKLQNEKGLDEYIEMILTEKAEKD